MKATLEKIAEIAYSTKKTLQYTYDVAETLINRNVNGCFVECGVGAGSQIAAMQLAIVDSTKKDRIIYAFDSFEGIPLGNEKDAEQPGIGAFTHDPTLPLEQRLVSSGITVHSLEQVKKNIESFGLPAYNIKFIEGWFQDTLAVTEVPEIALLRLDGDLYESTLVCLEHLYPKVVPGGVVIIDDYGLEGCRKAVYDYFKGNLPKLTSIETEGCHVVSFDRKPEIEITVEESQRQAFILEQIKLPMQFLDMKYLKTVAEAMRQEANNYDSVAALNRSYDPQKSNLMLLQAKAIYRLDDFINTLIECDKLKASIKESNEFQEKMKGFF